MRAERLVLRFSRPTAGYEIVIRDGALGRIGEWARKVLNREAKRVVVVSDRTVAALYGKALVESLRDAGLGVDTFVIRPGEKQKSLHSVTSALESFAKAGISRADGVVAFGGGVVGDLAGFASAIHLRGVAFLQVPTTLLAMVDSSVGGKTGVNSALGKNTVGAFHQPRGVLIDPAVLSTLPNREMVAGFCEMIKQGAVGDRALLTRTDRFLRTYRGSGFDQAAGSALAQLISDHVAFKAKVVRGDEQESPDRTDAGSRKVLNFGHTLAHALEKATQYKRLKHGEAVGYGIMYAAEVSKALALCGEKDVNLLYDVVHRVGSLPHLAGVDEKQVFEAFAADKKNTGGSLQMVLLRGIGKPVILSGAALPRPLLRKVLGRCLRRWA